jgi:hypothetical protein
MFVILSDGEGYLLKDGQFGPLDDALVIDDHQKAVQIALDHARQHNRLCQVKHVQDVHAEIADHRHKVCRRHDRTYRKAAYQYLPFQRTFVRVMDEIDDYDSDDDPLAGVEEIHALFLIMKGDSIEGYVAEVDGKLRSLTQWEAEVVADHFVLKDECQR